MSMFTDVNDWYYGRGIKTGFVIGLVFGVWAACGVVVFICGLS